MEANREVPSPRGLQLKKDSPLQKSNSEKNLPQGEHSGAIPNKISTGSGAVDPIENQTKTLLIRNAPFSNQISPANILTVADESDPEMSRPQMSIFDSPTIKEPRKVYV